MYCVINSTISTLLCTYEITRFKATGNSDFRAFYELTVNADLTLPTNRALHEQQNDI